MQSLCVALQRCTDNLLQVKRSFKLHANLRRLACFFLLFKFDLQRGKNLPRSDTNNVNLKIFLYENVNN